MVHRRSTTISLTAPMRTAVTPEATIASANGTTHPHGPTLTLLRGRMADLYCMPQHGIGTLLVDAVGNYAVRGGLGQQLSAPPASSVWRKSDVPHGFFLFRGRPAWVYFRTVAKAPTVPSPSRHDTRSTL